MKVLTKRIQLNTLQYSFLKITGFFGTGKKFDALKRGALEAKLLPRF